jgi:peptidoglycan/LPS O-acetylase OafA/YrhL
LKLETTDPGAATSVAPPRLAYLDGWRAVAVGIVILSHVSGFRDGPPLLKELARWLPVGQIGVLIFFFISGYVISRAALSEIGRTADFSVPAFYLRRAFRIIPPLALYLLTCVGLGALGLVDFHFRNAIPAFLYVCNVEPFNQCLWLAGHTWSLAFEEQFYLLFPALVSLIVLHRRPLLPLLLGALVFAALPLLFPLSYSGKYDFYLVYGLFGAGFFAARHEAAAAAVLRPVATLGLVAAAALVLLMPVSMGWPALYNTYPLSFLISIPLLVLCAGYSGLGRWLETGWLRYLGRISYAIYLWQELATSELTRRQPLLVELAAVAAVVGLSALLFEVMEKPLIRLGRRLSERVA